MATMIIAQKTKVFSCLGYAGPPPKPTKKAAKAADDDEMDLFGDSDEEAAPPADAKAARAAAAAAAKAAADAKKKPKKVDKSLVTLVVKPWEAETDLDELFKLITATEKEGLTWGIACEKEPVAYGIKKLVMTCVIVDSKVLMDDVTDKIEALDQWVQSVQVASMNKI